MTTLLEESVDKRAHSPLTWLFSRQTFWVFVAAVVAVTALYACHRYIRHVEQIYSTSHATLRSSASLRSA